MRGDRDSRLLAVRLLVWGSRVWGSTRLGLRISDLDLYLPGGLESGGLESGGLEGSGHGFRIWLRTYLGV